MFCLYNNKLQLYYKNKYVCEVLGEFYGYKIKQYADKIVLIGNFNIIVYKTKGEIKNSEDIQELTKNACILSTSHAIEQDDILKSYDPHSLTIYDFAVAQNIDKTIEMPKFYKKMKGDDIHISKDVWIVIDSNQLIAYEGEKEKTTITLPFVVKQINAKSYITKVYCLCEDGKIYVANLQCETYNNVISCNKRINQFCISFCETLIYVVTDDEIIAYFTKNDCIMDRFEIENKVEFLGVIMKDNKTVSGDYFDMKL
ncbi:hypothetical protein BDAP_000719 [Binucleata daphniae]